MSRNRRAPNQFRIRLRGCWCVYCGETATCDDHFPPYSAGLRGFLIPACGECNGIAGTEHPYNFGARAAWVKDKIRIKYKKLVDTPEWAPEELAPLGKNLKSSVRSWAYRRKAIMQRLAWNPIAYLAGIAGGKDLAALDEHTATEPGRERQQFRIQLDRIYSSLGAA